MCCADPVIIVHVYSSGLFSDEMRLLFCLIVHPLILEFCLHMLRQTTISEYDSFAQTSGHDTNSIDDLKEKELFGKATGLPLLVECIFVFDRRFLIG